MWRDFLFPKLRVNLWNFTFAISLILKYLNSPRSRPYQGTWAKSPCEPGLVHTGPKSSGNKLLLKRGDMTAHPWLSLLWKGQNNHTNTWGLHRSAFCNYNTQCQQWSIYKEKRFVLARRVGGFGPQLVGLVALGNCIIASWQSKGQRAKEKGQAPLSSLWRLPPDSGIQAFRPSGTFHSRATVESKSTTSFGSLVALNLR